MTDKMNCKPRLVRCPKCLNVLPEPSDVPVYKCGGCGATLQAKKRTISTVDTKSQKPDDDRSGKQKVERVFGDQEAGSSSNQQSLLDSTDELDQISDHDAGNKAKNKEYLSGKQKLKQLSDDHKTGKSSNQQPLVDNNIHNDPRSSTELSGNEDPESSPEATDHKKTDQKPEITTETSKQIINQISKGNEASSSLNQQLTVNSTNKDHEYNDDLDQVFLSCRHEVEFEESSSEFEEQFANNRTVRVSDDGSRSKSSFKSLIAEKFLDTKRKKPVHLDEDDELSKNGSADLHHHRRRFGDTSYYGGSVSSYDGNDDRNPRKHRIGSIEDDNVESGIGYRFNRRNHGRFGRDEHRSTEFRPFYGLNPRNRSHMISENPKLERIELLKMVRELQNQLERTNISNGVFNTPVRYGRRMAFSGETTAVNCSCYHCCPQDRHFSAQFSRQNVCCNGPGYEPNNTYYSPRISGLLSPIHTHPESEFSAPDGFRYRNSDVTKLVLSPMKKRYVRPIASGSPLITCYRCFKILELPQSFLVFNKKYHTLRCGACLKVLKFTLLDGTRVSRYYPEETIAAPPCSEVEEVEDYDELNGSRAGPISCSDRSFQKSYSTETNRNGSREFSEERRKVSMSRDASGSAPPCSSRISGWRRTTSESEAGPGPRPRPNGSPLHQLMGYASPSKVIRVIRG